MARTAIDEAAAPWPGVDGAPPGFATPACIAAIQIAANGGNHLAGLLVGGLPKHSPRNLRGRIEGRRVLRPNAREELSARLWAVATGRARIAPVDRALADKLERAAYRLASVHSVGCIRHIGLDPARTIAIHLSISGIEMHLPDGTAVETGVYKTIGQTTTGMGFSSALLVRLAPDVELVGDRWMLVPRMPETVAAAIVGRPLADLVSHPVLDPLGLRIGPISTSGDKPCSAILLEGSEHLVATTLADSIREQLPARTWYRIIRHLLPSRLARRIPIAWRT